MSYILSIETSDKICSVALSHGYNLIGSLDITDEKSHASKLTLLIEKLLDTKGFKIADLNAVAISKGPGSYTGLRIGVSVAKGICYALSVPLIAINTLQSLAIGLEQSGCLRKFQPQNNPILLCPMIDARRMEVYSAFFKPNGEQVGDISANLIEATSFYSILAENSVVFFGSGSEKCKNVIVHPNAHFVDSLNPHASFMVSLANDLYENSMFENVAYFEPFYLKDFVATTSKKSVL